MCRNRSTGAKCHMVYAIYNLIELLNGTYEEVSKIETRIVSIEDVVDRLNEYRGSENSNGQTVMVEKILQRVVLEPVSCVIQAIVLFPVTVVALKIRRGPDWLGEMNVSIVHE